MVAPSTPPFSVKVIIIYISIYVFIEKYEFKE